MRLTFRRAAGISSRRGRLSSTKVVTCIVFVCLLFIGLDVWRTWQTRSAELAGLGLDEVLARWRSEELFHLFVALCSALLIAGLGVRFLSLLRMQHRIELELESRERRYRLLAEHSTDLVIQLGPDLLHVYVSPASEALLLYCPSELIGQHPRQFAHPDDWPALSSQLSLIEQHGHAPPVSYRARRKDGTEVWVEAASRILKADQGYVVVIRDITDRKKVEAKLRQAQRMEAVGQLTAGVAHDFNNMLQAPAWSA